MTEFWSEAEDKKGWNNGIEEVEEKNNTVTYKQTYVREWINVIVIEKKKQKINHTWIL